MPYRHAKLGENGKAVIAFRFFLVLFFMLLVSPACIQASPAAIEKHPYPPDGFVYLSDIAPDCLLDVRYFSTYNFVGQRVDGYNAPRVICTLQTAKALKKVSDDCLERGYLLKIYDIYRPQKAVDHFVRWSNDSSDLKTKAVFYPNIEKKDLFKKGYIASKSGHSRGSTADLTLVDRATGKELDMGSPFDFLDPMSNHDSPLVTAPQTANRNLLKSLMEKHGFESYSKEWWHYTLKSEPHPKTYFNFDVN